MTYLTQREVNHWSGRMGICFQESPHVDTAAPWDKCEFVILVNRQASLSAVHEAVVYELVRWSLRHEHEWPVARDFLDFYYSVPNSGEISIDYKIVAEG